jgi:hypothetical protein
VGLAGRYFAKLTILMDLVASSVKANRPECPNVGGKGGLIAKFRSMLAVAQNGKGPASRPALSCSESSLGED